jgi:hypothetical protein
VISIKFLLKLLDEGSDQSLPRVTVLAHQIKLPSRTIDVPQHSECYATDRQANAVFTRNAQLLRELNLDPSTLNRYDYVSVKDAARAQGYGVRTP